MQNFDHNIGFCEKRQFFRRKLSKIAKNCDHNIGPRFFASWAIIYFGQFNENTQFAQSYKLCTY
jgi:hypothetical protein